MKKLVGTIAAGAVSRESMVVILPVLASRMTMNPPPPMPQLNGSTTPSTPAAATAASKALPPAASTSIAAFVASGSTLAAAPLYPSAVGCLACPCAAGGESATVAAAATTGSHMTRLMLELLPCLHAGTPARAYDQPIYAGSAGDAQHDRRGGHAPELAHAGHVDAVVGERGGGQGVGDAPRRA